MRSDPANAGWQRHLLVSFIKVGDVLVAQGKGDEALTAYRDSLAIAERLARADPANAGWQRDLSVSFDRVGDVLVAQGKGDEALTAYRDSLAIRERLARADPANAGWQGDLAASHGKLGLLHAALRDPATARQHFITGRAIVAGLVDRFPGMVLWRRYLEQFDRDLARLPP